MIPKEILDKVRLIEIRTRNMMNNLFAGEYHSVFKGRGMEFAEAREYQPGDDVRHIDWNVTARVGRPFIKVFDEEREMTVMLLVDVSASGAFGSQQQMKGEVGVEVSALLAFSAIQNNDRVGLITFTDKIETFIPPKKGRKHVLRVITEILEQRTTGRGTDISAALEHLSRITRKKAVVFLISDFQDEGFEKALNISSRRHEIVPVFLIDPMEEKLPNMGIIQVENPETGELLTVDTTSKKIRDAYERAATSQREAREKAFRKRKIDHVVVRTDEDYLAPLIKYFRLRARRA